MSNTEKETRDAISEVLDHSIADLDTATQRRLQHSRISALERLEQKRQARRLPLWGIVPSLATLVIIGVILFSGSRTDQATAPHLDELNLLTSTESLDLYAQDIEFYLWLAEVMDTDTGDFELPDS